MEIPPVLSASKKVGPVLRTGLSLICESPWNPDGLSHPEKLKRMPRDSNTVSVSDNRSSHPEKLKQVPRDSNTVSVSDNRWPHAEKSKQAPQTSNIPPLSDDRLGEP